MNFVGACKVDSKQHKSVSDLPTVFFFVYAYYDFSFNNIELL